jgi:NADH-quinone oxidoreductase subunit K
MTVVVVTSALFCLGLYGVLTRRELVGILACVELMMGAANVQLMAFQAATGRADAAGQAFALIILVLAAAEASVGLALVVTTVRRLGRGRMDELTEVRG